MIHKWWRAFKLTGRKIKEKLFGTQIDRLRKQGAVIGENVHLYGTYIDTTIPFLLTIGDNTTLTDVKVLMHDASTFKETGFTKMGKVTIGSNVFIGVKTVVLPGVTIGDRCIIGAGSVVSRDIPENSVAAGNPCKVVKSYDAYMQEQRARMKDDNCIPKLPGQLTKDEIADLRENMTGIWYIR